MTTNIRITPSELLQIFISLIVMIFVQFDFSLKAIEAVLFVVYVECVIVSFKDHFFNIYQLLLFMLLYFNFAIPFLHLFGLYIYPTGNMLMYSSGIRVPISDNTLILTYKVMVIVLCGTSLGWLVSRRNTNQINYNIKIQREHTAYDKVIRNIFFLLLIFELIYQILLVQLSIEDGYVETMHLHSKAGIILYILNIISSLYPISAFWVLYGCRKRKEYISLSILICIPYLIQIFTGYRGAAFSLILVLLYIYSRYFGRIKITHVLMSFAVIFLLISGIGAYRWSRDIGDLFIVTTSDNLITAIINEFSESSVSVVVLSYTIQLMDRFVNKVPFLFGYIFATFVFGGNYAEKGILMKDYLAQHITYLLNPTKLLRGSTIGTNISAEFYELAHGSYFIIFLLSVFLLIITGYIIKKLYKNQFWFYFGMTYLQHFLLSPRGSVMKVFNKISLGYLIFFLIISTISSKRHILSETSGRDYQGS